MNKLFSLYIHIPFCLSKCAYCDFFSIPLKAESIPDYYVESLISELIYRKNQFDVTGLRSVYIGGGTPSLLKEAQLLKILNTISCNYDLTCCSEVTIEVNPDDLNKEYLSFLNKTMVTRISCGIQSMNDKSLVYCGRRAHKNQNLEALKLLKEYWTKSLSLDLICGLPDETEESFNSSLKEIISYNPDHISMYSLTVEDETALGKKVLSGDLNIDYDFMDDLWLKGKNVLEQNGYEHYEVSNFCKPQKECVHNLRYWQHQNYIGVGSGACGTVYNEDGSCLRWTNLPDITNYIEYWENQSGELPEEKEIIDIVTSKYEFFMMGLRKKSGIKESEYKSCFKEDIPLEVINLFENWSKKNQAEIQITESGDKIYRLNDEGFLFLNRFLEELTIQ